MDAYTFTPDLNPFSDSSVITSATYYWDSISNELWMFCSLTRKVVRSSLQYSADLPPSRTKEWIMIQRGRFYYLNDTNFEWVILWNNTTKYNIIGSFHLTHNFELVTTTAALPCEHSLAYTSHGDSYGNAVLWTQPRLTEIFHHDGPTAAFNIHLELSFGVGPQWHLK